jgi:hypothetical protein
MVEKVKKKKINHLNRAGEEIILEAPKPGIEEVEPREREWKDEMKSLIEQKRKASVLFDSILNNFSLNIKRKMSDENYLKEFRGKELGKYEGFKEASKILENCYEKFKFLFTLIYPNVSLNQKRQLDMLSEEWNSELQRRLKKVRNVIEKQLAYSELFDRYILKLGLIVFHSID